MIKVQHDFETKSPVIHIDSYFFRRIHFEAHPIGFSDDSENNPFDIEVKTSVETTETGKSPYGLRLLVETTHEKASKAYDFAVEVFGVFSFDQSIDEKHRSGVLYTYGANILYGSIRELLVSLSLKGPFKTVMLPTVTFVPAPKDQK